MLREVRESQRETRQLQERLNQLQSTARPLTPSPQTFQIQFPDSLKIKIEK